jgi:hypothetical protein
MDVARHTLAGGVLSMLGLSGVSTRHAGGPIFGIHDSN